MRDISSSSEQMQLYIRTLIDISRAATGYQLHMEDIGVLAYVEQLQGHDRCPVPDEKNRIADGIRTLA